MSAILPKAESKAEFLASGFTRIMAGGKLPVLFNLVMAEARLILDDDDYESLAEKRYFLNATLGETKQALAIAAKRTIRCCGFPLLVRCTNCGCSLYVEEQGERRYFPGKFNRQAVPVPKKAARGKFTLRAARERAGYTDVAAAKLLGIKTKRLRELEQDCSKASLNMAERICQLYRLSMDRIYWGREDAYKQRGAMSHA
ncbi:hypothetical protein D3C76_307110 [compost metagenome]